MNFTNLNESFENKYKVSKRALREHKATEKAVADRKAKLLESMKKTLTERYWRLTIPGSYRTDIFNAADEGDMEQVKDSIVTICDYVIDNAAKTRLKEDELEDFITEWEDLKEELEYQDFEDEEEADYWLGEMYDLMDNSDVFLGLEESLKEDVALNDGGHYQPGYEKEIKQKLRSLLFNKGYDTDSEEVKNYITAAAELIGYSPDEYSVEEWYKDTMENYPNEFEALPKKESLSEESDTADNRKKVTKSDYEGALWLMKHSTKEKDIRVAQRAIRQYREQQKALSEDLYRQYEDPYALEDEYNRLKSYYDMHPDEKDDYAEERLASLKERINFAWQDDEYASDYYRNEYYGDLYAWDDDAELIFDDEPELAQDDMQAGQWLESLNEDVDLSEYEYAGNADGYFTYRKIIKDKDGNPHGIWAAQDKEEKYPPFEITYMQARGYDPIITDHDSNAKILGRELGRMLLPRYESLEEGFYPDKADEDFEYDMHLDEIEFERIRPEKYKIYDWNDLKRALKKAKEHGYRDSWIEGRSTLYIAGKEPLREGLDDGEEDLAETYRQAIIDWMYDHSQALRDIQTQMGVRVEDISLNGLKAWIAEHKQLKADFENYFHDDLDESCNGKKKSDKLAEGRKLIGGSMGQDDRTVIQPIIDAIAAFEEGHEDEFFITWNFGRRLSDSKMTAGVDINFSGAGRENEEQKKAYVNGLLDVINQNGYIMDPDLGYDESGPREGIFGGFHYQIVEAGEDPDFFKEALEDEVEGEEDDFKLDAIEKQEFTSKDTARGNSNKVPAVFKRISFKPGTINLDYGGGPEEHATEYLADQDVTNLVYDKYNRSDDHNKEIIKQIRANGGADTAVCSNVLNVIKEPEERLNVIRNIKRLLKPNGVAYFYIYDGNKSGEGRQTGKDSYQLNRKLVEYMDEIQQIFSNVKPPKKGMIVATNGGSANESLNENVEYKGHSLNITQDGTQVWSPEGKLLRTTSDEAEAMEFIDDFEFDESLRESKSSLDDQIWDIYEWCIEKDVDADARVTDAIDNYLEELGKPPFEGASDVEVNLTNSQKRELLNRLKQVKKDIQEIDTVETISRLVDMEKNPVNEGLQKFCIRFIDEDKPGRVFITQEAANYKDRDVADLDELLGLKGTQTLVFDTPKEAEDFIRSLVDDFYVLPSDFEVQPFFHMGGMILDSLNESRYSEDYSDPMEDFEKYVAYYYYPGFDYGGLSDDEYYELEDTYNRERDRYNQSGEERPWANMSLTEDTIKENGKWVNKGKEGTHGKFKTKKQADAQRKAMFANGYKAESLDDYSGQELDINIPRDSILDSLIAADIVNDKNMREAIQDSLEGIVGTDSNAVISWWAPDAFTVNNLTPSEYREVEKNLVKYFMNWVYDLYVDNESSLNEEVPGGRYYVPGLEDANDDLDDSVDNYDGEEPPFESLKEEYYWPNGMPVSDLDIEKALDFMYGEDRNMDRDAYSDKEIEKAINYLADRT